MLHLAKKMPVKRISPDGGHFFFGYYDLQPYNFNETLHLAHRVSFIDRLQTKNDSADVGFIEVGTGRYEKLDTTFAWNFQQGAMLQWNPVLPDREVVYNSYDKNGYCGVIMDIHNGKKRFLERPVANVSNDGRYALGINMQRLYDFRPGYGYAGEDLFYESNHPENDGVYVIDMQTGKAKLILSLDDIWSFSGGFFEKDEKIIVNHLTFNTSGTRFLLLVRNFPQPGEKHKTATITANRSGKDLYMLADFGMQSHYFWKSEKDVVIYSDGKELSCKRGWGNNYVYTDKTRNGYIIADGFFEEDNHMSFSPDKRLMITDTYPDSNGYQTVRMFCPDKNTVTDLGSFRTLPFDTTDIRCDLHPRWNRSGDSITFDSTHEGFRGIYSMGLTE